MSAKRYQTARLDEIEELGNWTPIRRHFGIAAFGTNAWSGDEGAEIIGDHDETKSGHEELYVVLSGHATFTVAGETVDAPAGTIVFVRDPEVRRAATATAAGTRILTVGAKPGEAYAPLGWEENASIVPLFARGEYAEAKERLLVALERFPDPAALLYNLACAEARLGEKDAALEHLRGAVEIEGRFGEFAQTDEDLESIRDDPRFPAANAVAQ
jgi:tetratricopeptide (TPR) repeat protein